MADPRPASVPVGVTGQDAAWVVVPTRLNAAALHEFCRDIERLFRINPYLEFSVWSALGAEHYRAKWHNLSNQQSLEIDLRVQPLADGLVVTYDSGLKQGTRFCINQTDDGSTLTVIDDYGKISEEEAAARLPEVDKSLMAWGEALRVYLLQERRWGRFAPYRWYRRALWLRLKPSARRIATLLVLFSLAEIVFLLFVVLIYWIEFS